jgi:glyoxylase-like metal-dependent hydrolase (beta-lactamase superfamily II)
MIHEILPVGPLQCNCSVIGDETTQDAMVIDPGDDIEDVPRNLAGHLPPSQRQLSLND